MSARHETTQAYAQEIDANRENLRGPKDGTVCYTNGGQESARAHVAHERAEGRDATTLEQTKYGATLDKDELWRNTPENRTFNNAERDRQKQAGVQNVDPRLAGTKEVWGKASQTYCEEARGKVTVVTNDKPIDEKGFFAKHERETLIRNEKVTHINGVERKQLETRLDAVNKAKAQQGSAVTEADRTKAAAAHKEALAKLNADIEKGDPTRTKDMSDVRKAPHAPQQKSRWDSHHQKSAGHAPERAMRKSK